MVVDTVFRHWEYLIVAEREEREGVGSSGKEGNGAETAGRKIRDQYDRKQWTEEGHQRLTVKAAFYAKNGVVASTDPGWLQLAFDFLMGLFDQVGLRMNIQKTVGMMFRP